MKYLTSQASKITYRTVDMDFDFPTIGEITRLFRFVDSNRPRSDTGRAKSSTLPCRRPDTSNNSRLYSSLTPGADISEMRHFSCLSSKRTSRSSTERKVWSARLTDRTTRHSSRRTPQKDKLSMQRSPFTLSKRAEMGSIFRFSEVEKQAVKHSTHEVVADTSADETETTKGSFIATSASSMSEENSGIASLKFTDPASDEPAVNHPENEKSSVNSSSTVSISECILNSPNTEIVSHSIHKPGGMSLRGETSFSIVNNAYTVETKNFSIKTFIEEGTRHAWVDISAEPHECIKVGNIKNGAGEALGLKPESLKIFGLFRGSLGDPAELLHEEDDIPENTYSFCLQRVSFSHQEERVITNTDLHAMELIFWEAQYMLTSDKIYPKPKDNVVEVMESLMENESPLIPRPSLANQERFVDMIRNHPLHYWSYYYRRENCTLEETVLDEYYIEKGTNIIVVMNIKNLIFIDSSSEEEIASWSWSKIRCLKMQNAPKQLFMFEVQVIVQESKRLNKISVATDNDYLYSIGSHIFKILEARQTKHYPLTDQLAEFSNKTFMRLENLAERREAKTKIMLVEEDEEVQEDEKELTMDIAKKKKPLKKRLKKNKAKLITKNSAGQL